MAAKRRIGGWIGVALIPGFILVGCDSGPTESGPTGPAPAVVELWPADGALALTIDTSVMAVFDESVSVEGVEAPVTLARNGAPVGGSITVSGDTVRFRPTAALDPGGVYTATLSAAIAGPGGATLGRDTSWSFGMEGAPLPAIDTARIMVHLRALADDSMLGRGSGTEAELRAAEYIRDQFQAMGLEPAPGGWLQTFPIPEGNPDSLVGASSQNVLGVIPGSGDLADQWVLVGAHYDHKGTDTIPPDSLVIYNGADDNASGTAVMLALAETLADYVAAGGTGDLPRRSIMFQAYGSEELGLVGSKYYVGHPVVPLSYHTAGMLCFDMVGRLRSDEVYISGLWTSPEWPGLVERYNATDLNLIDKQDCQSCSDYSTFRRAGQPAVWFFTGFHDQYHSPDDDVALIRVPGLARIADMAAGAALHLAVRADLLPFGSVAADR